MFCQYHLGIPEKIDGLKQCSYFVIIKKKQYLFIFLIDAKLLHIFALKRKSESLRIQDTVR